jgi:hypothetical protein
MVGAMAKIRGPRYRTPKLTQKIAKAYPKVKNLR